VKKILILGGHGDGAVVASTLKVLSGSNDIEPVGFLNDHESIGSLISGLPVLDRIENAPRFLGQENVYFISALLKAKKNYQRAEKIRKLKIPLERFFTAIHPQATVDEAADVGYGTYIGPHATVLPNAKIGNHCSIRASANVGHDCRICDFTYLGPNATLSGRTLLEEGVHIGPNACTLEGTVIGAFSVVGIGSAVIKNVPPFSVCFGIPARVIEDISPTQHVT
jgi:acetyltransferase EpsM